MNGKESLVLREDRGPVAVLTLNRPDRRNALSRALIAELGDAFDRLLADPNLRAAVLTGSGPTFCSGMDLKEAGTLDASMESEGRAVADTQAIADLIQQVHQFPLPTVAALNGDALAGGAGLATACDLIVMSAEARIGYPEVRRGLVAAVVMHDLIRQVGERRARELLLTGSPIDAPTADRWGLVNRVAQADRCLEEAIDLARSLVESAPLALSTTKRLLDDASRRPADLRGAAAISAAVRVSDEAAEGMRAFLEKRPTSWASRSPV